MRLGMWHRQLETEQHAPFMHTLCVLAAALDVDVGAFFVEVDTALAGVAHELSTAAGEKWAKAGDEDA